MIIVFEEKDIMSGFTADDLAYLAASISPEAWTDQYYPGVISIHAESEDTQILGYVPMAIVDELVQDCREDEIRQFIFNIINDDKKIHEGVYAFRDHTIVITNSPQTIYTVEAFKAVSRRIFEKNDDKEEFWRLLCDCIPVKHLASGPIWRSNGIVWVRGYNAVKEIEKYFTHETCFMLFWKYGSADKDESTRYDIRLLGIDY